MKKVLLIEDDSTIVDLLNIHLRDLQCDIIAAYDGETGLEKALNQTFDLIILDLMLPKMQGLEVCQEIRRKDNHIPILMLTAKAEEIDKVLGLEMGADDYLTKPFSMREFIARVKVIFRRAEQTKTEPQKNIINQISFNDLLIDVEKHKVMINNRRVDLSPKEYKLLKLLALQPGKTYSRQQLLDLIWGDNFNGSEHTVNTLVNRIRSKIESNVNYPKYILTTWGMGYRFNDEL